MAQVDTCRCKNKRSIAKEWRRHQEAKFRFGGDEARGKRVGLHKISLENWVPGTRTHEGDDCSRLSAFSFRFTN